MTLAAAILQSQSPYGRCGRCLETYPRETLCQFGTIQCTTCGHHLCPACSDDMFPRQCILCASKKTCCECEAEYNFAFVIPCCLCSRFTCLACIHKGSKIPARYTSKNAAKSQISKTAFSNVLGETYLGETNPWSSRYCICPICCSIASKFEHEHLEQPRFKTELPVLSVSPIPTRVLAQAPPLPPLPHVA